MRLCTCLLLVLASACDFSTTIGDEIDGRLQMLVDDDLAGGTVVDGVIANGNVEPDGFVLGGLHARGFQTTLVDNGEDFTKVLADAAAATQTGAAYTQVPANWMGDRPRGLGLVADSNYSVIYDGEILLPKGEVTLAVDVDDRGLVEVLGKTVANTGSVTLMVPDGGWYPIRAAMTQAGGNARFVMTLVQDQVKTLVDASRLRARVTNDHGLVVFVFDGLGFVGAHGQVTRPTIAENYGGLAPPFDLTTSFDQFSLRFAGQLRIDAPGTYMFSATIDGDDGWRLWIDGELVADHWLGHPDITTGAVDLTPGWHSILVDYADGIGFANITVDMTGPDAPAGGPIDPARLRPVVVFGNTYTFATASPTTIADATSTFVTMPLPGDPTERIDAVDYGFRIDNQDMSTLAVTLFDCSAGKPLPLNPTPSYHYFPADKSCAGALTNPVIDWQLRLADSAAGNGPFAGLGVVRDYGVSALYHGGPKLPFAPVVTYTSPARPTPGAKHIRAVRAIGTLDDTVIEIAVRAADDEAGLASQPFELVRDGEKIEAVGELVQYRVTMSTNGWISPVLDRVEIDYVVE